MIGLIYDVFVWSIVENDLGMICSSLPVMRILFTAYISPPSRRIFSASKDSAKASIENASTRFKAWSSGRRTSRRDTPEVETSEKKMSTDTDAPIMIETEKSTQNRFGQLVENVQKGLPPCFGNDKSDSYAKSRPDSLTLVARIKSLNLIQTLQNWRAKSGSQSQNQENYTRRTIRGKISQWPLISRHLEKDIERGVIEISPNQFIAVSRDQSRVQSRPESHNDKALEMSQLPLSRPGTSHQHHHQRTDSFSSFYNTNDIRIPIIRPSTAPGRSHNNALAHSGGHARPYSPFSSAAGRPLSPSYDTEDSDDDLDPSRPGSRNASRTRRLYDQTTWSTDSLATQQQQDPQLPYYTAFTRILSRATSLSTLGEDSASRASRSSVRGGSIRGSRSNKGRDDSPVPPLPTTPLPLQQTFAPLPVGIGKLDKRKSGESKRSSRDAVKDGAATSTAGSNRGAVRTDEQRREHGTVGYDALKMFEAMKGRKMSLLEIGEMAVKEREKKKALASVHTAAHSRGRNGDTAASNDTRRKGEKPMARGRSESPNISKSGSTGDLSALVDVRLAKNSVNAGLDVPERRSSRRKTRKPTERANMGSLQSQLQQQHHSEENDQIDELRPKPLRLKSFERERARDQEGNRLRTPSLGKEFAWDANTAVSMGITSPAQSMISGRNHERERKGDLSAVGEAEKKHDLTPGEAGKD
jgi:hypothetical protein